jgi:cellulose synthase/poly-beta-1,6-N-acetylglucosamine synthase-like glycosyltransferase
MNLISLVIYISVYIGLVATSFYILSFIDDQKRPKKLFKDDELPRVSIIIPAYNEEESIGKTIESILLANYPKGKMEIIVVDDGSKDKTFSIAKEYEGVRDGKIVRVFTKSNGGKGAALNFGIKKCNNEFIFSMDADTFIGKESVKEMVRYFKDKQVMSVTSAMTIHNPKGLLQKMQHVEYLFGLFLRKAFASLNSLYITPGAFSAYRKSFFEKHGGYAEDDITEDLELAMRIQYYGYKIENAPNAPVYTIAPSKFKQLTQQRKRWYVGLTKNTWRYRMLFGPKYGDLGMFVLPIAWISIFLSLFVVFYFVIDSILETITEIAFLQSINYDVISSLKGTTIFFERLFYILFSNTIFLFLLLFLAMLGFYLNYAKRKMGDISGWKIGLPLFFVLFAILFGFWWIVSFIYLILNKKVKWK